MVDTGQDLAAALNDFRVALRGARKPCAAAPPGMGLYDAAMVAGQAAPGGFAPIAGAAEHHVGPKQKLVASVGEGRSVQAVRLMPQTDVMGRAIRRLDNEMPSYRAVIMQAKEQAAAVKARRQAGRVALLLPAREEEAMGMSFAPPSGAGVGGEIALNLVQGARPVVPGLRRGGSVHSAVAAAEAASRDADGTVKGQAYEVSPETAQAVMEPSDIRQVLDEYFFRQSRLPPNGGAAFNPLLSPIWAGLKIPG